MRSYIAILLSTILVIGLAGCADSPNLPARTGKGESTDPGVLVDAYKMAVGDVVQVNVWKNPELSVTEPIRPDGKIALPLVGYVMAAGKVPEELADEIKERLSTYVKNPRVIVILTNLEGHAFLSRVRVTGSVAQNISIPYHQGMTVLDAVLEAGSVDEFADSNETKLHRRTYENDLLGNGIETYDIRLKDILEDGDMRTNVLLRPGDIITVPERSF
jgi:polysaccharide export outer membrane protein